MLSCTNLCSFVGEFKCDKLPESGEAKVYKKRGSKQSGGGGNTSNASFDMSRQVSLLLMNVMFHTFQKSGQQAAVNNAYYYVSYIYNERFCTNQESKQPAFLI